MLRLEIRYNVELEGLCGFAGCTGQDSCRSDGRHYINIEAPLRCFFVVLPGYALDWYCGEQGSDGIYFPYAEGNINHIAGIYKNND